MKFNPVNLIFGLIAGWFILSFLQSAVTAIFIPGGPGLIPQFKLIAFFQDSKGILINVVLMIVLGAIGTSLWFLLRKPS